MSTVREISIFLFLIFLSSCNQRVTKSKYYRVAIERLVLKDRKSDYAIISKNDIKKSYLTYFNRDTLHLNSKDYKMLFFKNKMTNKIFIYQFKYLDYYKVFECDSAWNVLKVEGRAGVDY